MGMYSKDMKASRDLLSRKMHLATWTQMPFWNKFIGFIGSKGRYPESIAAGQKSTRLAPTGQPIEVLTDFQHQGGLTMDIPVKYPLTEPPVYGDNQLLGTEESSKIAYKIVHINQVRKGVKVSDGAMSDQVLQRPDIQLELMGKAQVELTDYNMKWNGYQPYSALLTRYSLNLTAAKKDGGLGLTAQSHPNFYVEGAGKVAFSNTASTYETNVATALSGLVEGDATQVFSTRTIEKARLYASKLKIQPVLMDGEYVFPMVISEAQADQLWQDEKWLAAQHQRVTKDGKAAAVYTGVLEGVYRGVAIFVDSNIPGATIEGANYDSSRGTVNYGNANPIADPRDSSPIKLAILFGASAVACGYASQLKFEKETWDYNNKKTEGSKMIVGYERPDIYDIDGYFGDANLFKENTSSLVIATYSPDLD
jgi:hypothetical protein